MQILIAIITVNVFVVVLCALIELGGRIFRASGTSKIQVNGNVPQETDCGQNLLTALSAQGIFLSAACGGRGTCGRCKVKVEKGGGPLMPLERINLQQTDLSSLLRLACQVKIRQDLCLQIDEGILSTRSFKAVLEHSQVVAHEIKTLHFKLVEANESLSFVAGQYLQVFYQLPWEKVVRAYSISSSPDDSSGFSLDVQRVDGGLMSCYLHSLSVGDMVEVCGPFGEMKLAETDADTPLVFVAGGVGLAPLRSMVSALKKTGFNERVLLFHGARSRVNLYCEEHFRQIAARHANFSYFPVLSNPMIEEGWTGKKGLVHEIVAEEPFAGGRAKAFLCGPEKMIVAVTKVLVAKGLAPDKIITDPFDF